MKNVLDYHFYVVFHTVITEMFPLNWLECTLDDELERGQIFYRRKMSGSLTFGGKRLIDDFDYLYGIYVIEPYERLDLIIMRGPDIYYEGYFTMSDGAWNLDDCTYTTAIKPSDTYIDWSDFGEQQYNILDVVPVVTVETALFSYNRNRWLWDVIEFLADNVFPGCTVTSQFFTGTTNYVTLKANKLLYLTIAQKSDIKRPTSTNPATSALMSFSDMMDIIKMFNAYWTYDIVANEVTIEHVSYFNKTAGVDLRTQTISRHANKFTFDKSEMPKYEKFNFMEALYPDFVGVPIYYDSSAVKEDLTTAYTSKITTDLEMIHNDPNSVSDEGFVMLANYLDGGAYYVYFNTGILEAVIRYNMPLSWSYLQDYYHRHGRVFLTGYMNDILTTFISARKTKIQQINARICPAYENDSDKYITTELGETYFGGEKGYVQKAIIKPYDEINFTLLYGPSDNVNTGVTPDPKNIRMYIQLDGMLVRTYLSEANIYDTYIWLWINDDECQEIMVPAGTTYQSEALTDPGDPVVSIKFNLTDASLTGWTFIYNDGEAYVTCTDLDCGGGVPPPAVPLPPVAIGCGQVDTCGPINVGWNASVDATYYCIYRKPDLSGLDNWVLLDCIVGLNYDDPQGGAQDGILFTYRIAAGNISGLSGYSNEVTFTAMC